MEMIDLEARVKEAARKVETIGAQRREASGALRRAILAHRSPGEVEDLEFEDMALHEAMAQALAEHFAATIALCVARGAAQSYKVA